MDRILTSMWEWTFCSIKTVKGLFVSVFLARSKKIAAAISFIEEGRQVSSFGRFDPAICNEVGTEALVI